MQSNALISAANGSSKTVLWAALSALMVPAVTEQVVTEGKVWTMDYNLVN